MKIFSGGNRKSLGRSGAVACAGINLLATPGLGTILAGRYWAGAVQLLAAVAGFALIMLWFGGLFKTVIDGAGSAPSWLWQFGVLFFGAAWLGSLWSSISMVRNASAGPNQTPPKLDGSRG